MGELEPIFDLASAIARGDVKTQVLDGRQVRISLSQRKRWARAAAQIAKIIHSIARDLIICLKSRSSSKIIFTIKSAKGFMDWRSSLPNLIESFDSSVCTCGQAGRALNVIYGFIPLTPLKD
jgi:hypothetical protein